MVLETKAVYAGTKPTEIIPIFDPAIKKQIESTVGKLVDNLLRPASNEPQGSFECVAGANWRISDSLRPEILWFGGQFMRDSDFKYFN